MTLFVVLTNDAGCTLTLTPVGLAAVTCPLMATSWPDDDVEVCGAVVDVVGLDVVGSDVVGAEEVVVAAGFPPAFAPEAPEAPAAPV